MSVEFPQPANHKKTKNITLGICPNLRLRLLGSGGVVSRAAVVVRRSCQKFSKGLTRENGPVCFHTARGNELQILHSTPGPIGPSNKQEVPFICHLHWVCFPFCNNFYIYLAKCVSKTATSKHRQFLSATQTSLPSSPLQFRKIILLCASNTCHYKTIPLHYLPRCAHEIFQLSDDPETAALKSGHHPWVVSQRLEVERVWHQFCTQQNDPILIFASYRSVAPDHIFPAGA